MLTVSETIEPSTAQPEEYHIMLLGVDQQTDATYNEYDSYNRLTKAIISDTVAEYEYAPNGLRLSKKINGNTTSYVWDGTNIVFEKESTNEVKYLRGINLISRQTATEDQYYLFNAHGDVTALTSNTGQVDKTYEYDAYGNEVSPVDNDINPFRYSGEFYDKETGTYYLRARYYDPVTSRMLSEDTVRFVAREMLNGHVFMLVTAAAGRTIVIGQSMDRVIAKAQSINAEVYNGLKYYNRLKSMSGEKIADILGKADNALWIINKMAQDYKIVDIGINTDIALGNSSLYLQVF